MGRMQLNPTAEEKARRLIEARQYVKESDWSSAQPSTEEENDYLDRHGWTDYGDWHLGIHEDEIEAATDRLLKLFG